MKKLLLTSALVAATSTAAIAADGSNFFVGLYGGYMGSASSVNSINNAAAGNNTSADLGGNGGQGGLMLGWNYMMDNGSVVGIDAFGQFGSHEASVTNTNANAISSTDKHKYAFGAALRFGYLFDTTHAYLRVGYINGRHEFTAQRPAVATSVTNVNRNLSGLLLGLGADMPVGEMMTVGFNYDFAIYRSETVTLANTAPAATSQFKPRTHALNVVLKYQF